MLARTLAGTAVLVASALAGCLGEDTPVVETAEVTAAEVTETVSAPARVDAVDRQEVRAEVAGTVAELTAQDGDAVSAGDLVVRLESAPLDDALEEAEDALAALEEAPEVQAAVEVPAVVPAPDAGNPLQGAVAELDANVAPQLEAAREAVRAAGERQAELSDEVAGALPEDADVPDLPGTADVEAAVDALDSTYQGVREALLAAGEAAAAQQRELSSQLVASVAEVEAALEAAMAGVNEQVAEAQRAQAETARAQVAAQREALVVEAPISGFVELGRGRGEGLGLEALGGVEGLEGFGGQAPDGAGDFGGFQPSDEPDGADGSGPDTPLREGASVTPGQPLFTVLDQSDWYVSADVDEVDAPAVAEGQRATVLIDAFPGEEFEGVVESVALTAERGLTGGVAFPTRIRLLDAPDDPAPRVGMTASAEIATATVEADLTVPSRAVVRRDVGTAVYAVRDDVAALVPVEVVAQGDELAAVEGDLEPGERVIVAGYEDLVDGSEVRTE